MQILAFGASITWGSWDSEGGWVDRLKHHYFQYMEKHPEEWVEVFNLGICGQTSQDLVKRFQSESEPRISPDKDETVFLFAFGGNDAAFVPAQNSFIVPPDEFKKNLQQVVREAKTTTKHVALLTITPLDESAPDFAEPEKVRKNEYVEMYNKELRDLAAEEQVGLIDVHSAFLETKQSLFCEDGLHPNTRGHEIIFKKVLDYLETKLD